jgi:O-antigen/teichoic acid export membrane protein
MVDLAARTLTAIATIAAILWVGKNPDRAAVAVIVGVIFANYLVALVTIGIIRPNLDHGGTTSRLHQVWKYSLPSYAANTTQFANYRLDVFLVAYFIGVRDVALYGVAVSCAQLLWLPSNAMQAVLFPRLSAMSDEHQKAEEAAQIMRLMLILTFLAGTAMAILAPYVLTLLFGTRFTPSLPPLMLLLPGIVVFCIANVLCGYLAAIGKPRLNFLSSLAGLIATLSLDIALIPRLGIKGAAIASSVSYSISAIVALYFFIHESGLSLAHTLWITKGDLLLALHTFQQTWHRLFLKSRLQ